MFSKHVTRDISAYCHGELSAEESKQFAEHIISCAKCRTKFDEVKLGIKLAEQLPRLTNVDPRPWLLQLAEDEDPSVRRTAAGILQAARPGREQR